MKKSITKNYIYNLFYQIALIILPIITTPYLSRVLGAENIGIHSYTISIVTYFILFGSLGLSIYGQREIAFIQDDLKKRSKTFYEILIIRTCSFIISMSLFFIVYGNATDYTVYYRILLLEMLAYCVDISWFYQGIEYFKKIVVKNIFIKILSVISIFVFVKGPDDLYKYFIIYVLTNLSASSALWFGLWKYVTKVNIRELTPLKHLMPALALFIPQIAMEVYTVLDKTMIGYITSNMSEVGFYEQSQKIVKLLLTIITSLGTVMMPRIAKCFADGKDGMIKEYMYKTFKFVYLLAFPIILGIIAVSNKFVPIFLGDGYDRVKLLLKLLSPIVLFIGMSNVIGSQYLISTKKQKQFTISVTCGAFINLILNFILIRYYQSIGAVIATVIAELSVTLVQIYFIRNKFKISSILKLCKDYLISALIMFIIVYPISFCIESNYVSLFVQVILGAIVYFCLLLFVFKDELLIEILKRFKIIK